VAKDAQAHGPAYTGASNKWKEFYRDVGLPVMNAGKHPAPTIKKRP
jgi:hypothetical protein